VIYKLILIMNCKIAGSPWTICKYSTLAGCNRESEDHCCWNIRGDMIVIVFHNGRRN